ncbi:MAG: urocanate hydratase [Phycisphaerales bacterium]|nr:urocanate hydratase [Phycisphaerales bacterium]
MMTLDTKDAVARTVRAPTGPSRTCKTWQAEAAMRMLMNNLDPDVAEDPDNLVVYGGRGQAARSWAAFDAIITSLKQLEPNETLLVQSGKPVGILETHPDAPRVLIANSNLVPRWATQQHFDELAAKGLMMYGQMTAGSWIYIGTQGILQGTYETFAECARQHFHDDMAGTWTVTGGCGGMGGAQPLSITLNGGACLIADVNRTKLQRRIETRYLDEIAPDIDAGIDRVLHCAEHREGLSIGVVCNIVELHDRILQRELVPDIVTDQTPAHDVLSYVPEQLTPHEAEELRSFYPEDYERLSVETMTRHTRMMVEMQSRGSIVFDYGNNLRQRAYDNGYFDAFAFPGFVPAYIRPQFCRGRGPFRWVALSGNPNDILETDWVLMELFPKDEALKKWLHAAEERVAQQGLPARICWLGQGERAKAGLAFNQLVADGKVSAPIVIGRDHLDCGSVASPNRETEGMKDGTDAVSDWAILNALVNTAAGASWVSFHHGGGVGIGFSQHAGQVIVADGTPEAAQRLRRVLTNDPAMGVFRHCDAGYDLARQVADEHHLKIPMRDW